MTKANRKFRTPSLFRLVHPKGSFRDRTIISLVNHAQIRKAEADAKKRKRKEQKAKNLYFYRTVKPSRKSESAMEKMGISIKTGFAMAKKWKDEYENEQNDDKGTDIV
ncbi:hypothetical protein KAX02_00395 [candidate division WOR-3 bacterium]|nr:hypothetical protein [candidate division WOR-3 bacterium]